MGTAPAGIGSACVRCAAPLRDGTHRCAGTGPVRGTTPAGSSRNVSRAELRTDRWVDAPLPVVPAAIAPVGRRVGALMLDQLVSLASAVLLVVAWLAFAMPTGTPLLIVLVVVVASVEAAQAVAEAVTGATVGAAALGLRTVGAGTGLPAGLIAVLVRRLVVLIGIAVGFVGGYLVAASGAWDVRPARRGWHDKAAGTMVLLAWTVPSRAERAAHRAAPAVGDVPVLGDVPVPAVVRSSPVPFIPTQAGPRSPRRSSLASVRAPSAPPDGPVATPVRDERVLVPAGYRTAQRSSESGGPGSVGRQGAASEVELPRAVWSDVVRRDDSDAARPGDRRADRSAVANLEGLGAPPANPPASGSIEVPASFPGSPWVAAPWSDVAEPAFAPGLSDDVELTRMTEPTERTVLRAPRVRLEFDTGERVDVVSDGAVGRDPAFTSGASAHHQVSIVDPERSVSRLHLLFGPDGDGPNLWVTDAGSTNGTVLIDPTGSAMVLAPGVRAVVEPGWLIRFGDRTAMVVLVR